MNNNHPRPKGIVALALAEIVLGVFALVGGVVHLTLGIGGLVDFSGRDLTLTSSVAAALQDAFTIEGLMLLIAGYGVWSKRSWSFALTVLTALIGLVTSLAALALQSSFSIVGIIANLGILTYTSRRNVREYFRGGTRK